MTTKILPATPNRGPILHRKKSKKELELFKLERKPQQNLSIIYNILLSSICDIEGCLCDLEKLYLGSQSIKQELRQWTVPINKIISLIKVSGLFSLAQVDDVIKRLSLNQDLVRGLEKSELQALKDVVYKIKEFVPKRFNGIIDDLKATLYNLEKYCLSFYDASNPVGLDTAKEYEKQRQEYLSGIPDCLNRIQSMWETFTSRGLFYTDLSLDIKDLCRASSANNAAFLLLFYEACTYVRAAITMMRRWIEDDANYAKFLRFDIKAYEKELNIAVKALRGHQHKYHQLGYRLKNTKSEHDVMTKEINSLQDTEDELIVEEEMLNTEANEIQVQMELIEYSRDQLIKKATSTDPAVLYEKYSQFSEKIRALEAKLPHTKKRLISIQNKLDWLKEKKTAEKRVAKEIDTIKNQLKEIESLKEELELEISDLEKKLNLAKKIHLQKTSSDAVTKIFFQQPLEANHNRLPGAKGKQDPFEQACQVVASQINTDWKRFYRHLPFVPSRGENTKDKDLQELSQMVARIGLQDVIIRSLHKWRRYHIRAKLEDLRETLESIQRYDVIRQVEEALNPTKPAPEASDDVLYSYVEPYLIPFLKEVEKFDELRAANRI